MPRTLTRQAVATRITVARAEGHTDECRTVTVAGPDIWAAADWVLTDMSYTAPHLDAGHHKTDVSIEFSDGSTYRTVYPLAFHNHARLADVILEERTYADDPVNADHLNIAGVQAIPGFLASHRLTD